MNELYLHLRRYQVVPKDAMETKTALQIATEGATKAHAFFKTLEREARAAQLVIVSARGKLSNTQATGQERTTGLDEVEDAYRRLHLVLTGYALFKAQYGDLLVELAACNIQTLEATGD